MANMFGFDPNIDPITGKKRSTSTKRSFTQTQKNEILHKQNNHCAYCKKPLDPRTTEFHHKKMHSAGGASKISNGIALHPDCHKKVHHEERLKSQEKKPKKDTNQGGFGGFRF
jgi:5-methylcytosine-specific restriction endonuclease McrA